MHKYKVKCLDAKYDEENLMLVLNCWFIDYSSIRLVCFNKSDFHYKQPGIEVPDIEMHKTAALFKDKNFNIEIDSDPHLIQKTDTELNSIGKEFAHAIGNEMEQVSDGLKDESQQIQRELGRMASEGKLDVKKLLQNEIAIQAKLGNICK